MEKMPGVESATVQLNEGRAVMQLKPGNSLTMAQVRERVRNNGFTPREAAVTAVAEPVLTDDRLRLKISGTDDVYDVRTTSEGLERLLRAGGGQSFVIKATIPFEKDANTTPVLQVTSAKPFTR